MLAEVRVMLPQEWIDEVHKLGGSLQYAIEDSLSLWLFEARRREHEHVRRSIAAKRAALTKRQRSVAKYMRTRDADGYDIRSPKNTRIRIETSGGR